VLSERFGRRLYLGRDQALILSSFELDLPFFSRLLAKVWIC